jgi:hypothetical protein
MRRREMMISVGKGGWGGGQEVVLGDEGENQQNRSDL